MDLKTYTKLQTLELTETIKGIGYTYNNSFFYATNMGLYRIDQDTLEQIGFYKIEKESFDEIGFIDSKAFVIACGKIIKV